MEIPVNFGRDFFVYTIVMVRFSNHRRVDLPASFDKLRMTQRSFLQGCELHREILKQVQDDERINSENS
jgi:hypothetical protein